MTPRKPRSASSPATSEAAEDTSTGTTVASFEEAMRRLTHIVEDLEGGELSLEESLARFEEGVRLARDSQARLDAAEARVEELLRVDEGGQPVVRELDVE